MYGRGRFGLVGGIVLLVALVLGAAAIKCRTRPGGASGRAGDIAIYCICEARQRTFAGSSASITEGTRSSCCLSSVTSAAPKRRATEA